MAQNSSPGTVTDSSVIANALAPQPTMAQAVDAAYDKAVADEGKKDGNADDKTKPGTDGLRPDDGAGRSEPKLGTDREPGVEEPEKERGTGDDGNEGYYADEGLETVEPAQLQTAQGQTEMGQWVLDNLPSISIQGVQGGKAVVLQVKRAEDLPNDFEFNSKRDEKIFDQGIADQTNRAYRLIEKYQSDAQAAESSKFSAQEDRDIQTDIAALQREGEIGRFKYAPNDTRFENDPAVKEMQEVLDFYNQTNQTRWAESQRTGRLFSRLSYRDAYEKFRVTNPKTTPEQTKEDTSRKAATRTIAGAGRGTEQANSKPQLRRNASIDEIINAYGVE